MSRAHWLALACLSGIGSATARRLLARFGDIASVFAASPEELEQVPRMTPLRAEQLLAVPIERLEAELLSLDDEGIDLLTWDDERFPAHLRALRDAPLVLFMQGSLLSSDSLAVAIVGTCAASPDGSEAARALGRELAARGLTIVSGLAPGVDTAAHRGAVESAAGRTLAVLGSGLRFVHPRENVELAERIADRGALLSELHPNARPRGPQLMARDRIVSGLSRAVVVVEAGENSGSLDTAARAKKQGRLVFAVPGSPATEQLLAAGARCLQPDSSDFDALAVEIATHPLPCEVSVPPPRAAVGS
jgi:DNA processing protein